MEQSIGDIQFWLTLLVTTLSNCLSPVSSQENVQNVLCHMRNWETILCLVLETFRRYSKHLKLLMNRSLQNGETLVLMLESSLFLCHSGKTFLIAIYFNQSPQTFCIKS